MKITVELDVKLIHTAQELTGVTDKNALFREALKALIERESARRLASLGGTMPQLRNVPRRRAEQKSMGQKTIVQKSATIAKKQVCHSERSEEPMHSAGSETNAWVLRDEERRSG